MLKFRLDIPPLVIYGIVILSFKLNDLLTTEGTEENIRIVSNSVLLRVLRGNILTKF